MSANLWLHTLVSTRRWLKHTLVSTIVWSMSGLVRREERDLDRWFDKRRRKPLVIRGARQVGKSTLVRRFVRRRELTMHEINLERHRGLDRVFASLDVALILREIEGLLGSRIEPGHVLFLDEIQSTPMALPALRYLYEERPELAVVAAGSLLEMLLGDHSFSMPVGRVEYLHLGPLTFSEFLEARGESHALAALRDWAPGQPFAATLDQRLRRLQREFLVVGGMPEAVDAWTTDADLATVADVHRSIVDTYRDDFNKYTQAHEQLRRLQLVFDYVPTALGTKVKYSRIEPDSRARELRRAIDLLAMARVVWRVHHSDATGIGLAAQSDPHTYKLLFMDVGLVCASVGITWNTIGSWDDRTFINEGGLAEQFIGQHLLFRQGGSETPSLNYWLREGRAGNAEVDYVIPFETQVVPIEVKAGTSGTLKSLHRFFARGLSGEPRAVGVRFGLTPPSLTDVKHQLTDGPAVSYRLLSLPLYMVDELMRLLELV